MTFAILSRTGEKWLAFTILAELFQQNRSLNTFSVPFSSLSSSRGSGGVSLTSGSFGFAHENKLTSTSVTNRSAVSFFISFTSFQFSSFYWYYYILKR